MRVALIYPPPWKMPAPGQRAYGEGQGAPAGFHPSHLDGDFFQMPYGMMSLAAQVRRAGHAVKLLNLSAFPWPMVEQVTGRLEADLVGLSCFTANRRGVAFVAQSIKRARPGSFVIVGGPHATALPRELLEHHAEIDAVAIGEGEETLLEVIDRLGRGEPMSGVAGLAWRQGQRIRLEQRRERIRNLDTLASAHELFDTHLVVTSRGCPGRCTFCATKSVWGHAYRVQSEERVLDDLERALSRLPLKMLMIKDETFSASRKRALRICEGIVRRGLRFTWSCDTRADALDEELIRAMRRAGCERLSLGVESGSPRILQSIGKNITPETMLRTTQLAKKYGLPVRFFMILGNRGETAQSFGESLRFLEKARPNQYIFACLSIYPGTQDFVDLNKAGALDTREYFEGDFQELKVPFDASEADTAVMTSWFDRHGGVQTMYEPGVAECEDVTRLLPGHAGAELDLGAAHYRAGQLQDAEAHVRRALELGHPLPGLAHNYLACVAFARRDIEGMLGHFRAAEADPWHPVLMRNQQRVRQWLAADGPKRGLPLALEARHEFELFLRATQPSMPGPLAPDWHGWE